MKRNGWIGLGYLLAELLGVIGEAWPEPVSPDQAAAAVHGWLLLDAQPLGVDLAPKLSRVAPIIHAGRLLGYAVYSDSAGFVLTPADDRLEPILGFAPRGCLVADLDNPLGALVIRDLLGRLERINIGLQPVGSATAPFKWQRFWNASQAPCAKGVASISDIRVPALIQSVWDQGNESGANCYNYFTPKNYPCGCGPTATAQIMRYHQYPAAGVGTASFEVWVDGIGETHSFLGGNGAGGPYNWALMPLNPDATITEAQRQAIGALCHDIGISVQASYASFGTSTSLSEIARKMCQYFGYSQAVYGFDSGRFLGAALLNMLNPNLDAGFPCILQVQSATLGGHGVICDGYGYNGGTLYHHLNLGWGTYYSADNAWYALPVTDTSVALFDDVICCVYNIFPSQSGEIVSGRILDNAGQPLAGARVTATAPNGAVYTDQSDSRGIYALAVVPSNTTFTLMVTATGYSFSNQTVATTHSESYSKACGNCWGIDFTGAALVDLRFQPIPRDYDGDGKTEPALYQESSACWGVLRSGLDYSTVLFTFGAADCMAAAADYDGDGLADPAVYQDESAYWGFKLSGQNYATVLLGFGLAGAAGVASSADYDGDRKADPALYLDQYGLWGFALSGQGYAVVVLAFGTAGAGQTPVAADFDGDGKADPALYEEATGFWSILYSASHYPLVQIQLGGDGRYPVTADYNGDGKVEAAAYQVVSGSWTFQTTSNGMATWPASNILTNPTMLGGIGYYPVAADYDGDHKADPAVYHDSTASWTYLSSSNNYQSVTLHLGVVATFRQP